ncbi:DUF1048 domain-containing protein [Nonomuraea typhae]|uniref:DUF1048 domain-containing protein n=1 Tax=Nonomuraea typhae TaxID=2603600 RepID=UPI0012FCF6D8|nr:DUF1048 domain-containing protein [Nonomuraea typhae]
MAAEVKKGWRFLGVVTGPLGDKKRYRRYRARVAGLPADYRAAVEALDRYMQHFAPGDAESLLKMLEDLADLFEQSAADGTPIRDVVGQDPLEFAETFLRNYADGSWIGRERARLTKAIDRATGGQQ